MESSPLWLFESEIKRLRRQLEGRPLLFAWDWPVVDGNYLVFPRLLMPHAQRADYSNGLGRLGYRLKKTGCLENHHRHFRMPWSFLSSQQWEWAVPQVGNFRSISYLGADQLLPLALSSDWSVPPMVLRAILEELSEAQWSRMTQLLIERKLSTPSKKILRGMLRRGLKIPQDSLRVLMKSSIRQRVERSFLVRST